MDARPNRRLNDDRAADRSVTAQVADIGDEQTALEQKLTTCEIFVPRLGLLVWPEGRAREASANGN